MKSRIFADFLNKDESMAIRLKKFLIKEDTRKL